MPTNADAHITVSANVSSATEQLKQLENAITSVNNSVSGFKGVNGSYSKAMSDMVQDIKNATKEFTKATESIAAAYTKSTISGAGSGSDKATRSIKKQTRSIEDMSQAINDYAINQQKLDSITARLNQRQLSSIQSLKANEEEYQSTLRRREGIYNASSKAFESNVSKFEQALASQQKLENSLTSREQVTTNGFLRRIQNSAAYIAGYGAFNTITTGLTSGLGAIRDFELGVTDLRRTLDQGSLSFNQFEAQLDNFGRAAVEDAKDFGVAITDAQEAMTELARAGVDSSNLEGMTESVLMGLNTTELETASEVTSALVSTIKQMDMEWSDSSMILDSWNFLADRYAVQTDDFAHAIERSGAASKMLGMDLYDLNAVVTILGESTQASGEEVGTAFRSLSARLLRDSTINKLAEYGIQVKDTNGSFLDFRDIMMNINDVIKDLPDDSIVLSDIMDTLGGAWRKNWITALTQDFGRFDELVRQQAESIGYSAEENEKAMDTIAKKAETLKQTFLEAFIDIGEAGGEDAIKDFLDGTASALESAINSPTLRSITGFLFGNPLEALGVAAGAFSLSKLTKGLGPLQAISGIINSKIATSDSTLAGWMNTWYDNSGVSGKQNRAEKLYNSIKKTYDLTDTEMLPIAGRIDEVFKSSTASIAQTGSEVERLKAQLADAEAYSRSLFSDEGKRSFSESMMLTTGNASQGAKSSLAALEREQQRSLDVVVQTKRELQQLETTQKKLQETSTKTAERGIFNTLTSSGLKEGIRGFVGGLASGAVQMVAIAAAAKGIDWLLHRDENAHNDFSEALSSYQEMASTVDQAQQLAEDFDAGKAGLISSTGENLGLDSSVFNSINAQLEQLKSISPDVASAIEKNAREMGNYGQAAEIASEALLKFEQSQATTFVSDNMKQYQKDMNAWRNDLEDFYGEQESATKALGHDFFSDIGVSTSDNGYIDFRAEDEYLDNIQDILDHRQEVTDALDDKGWDQEKITEYFDSLNDERATIKSAITSAQEMGIAEFKRNLYKNADEVAAALGGVEQYDKVVSSLYEMIGEAQSIDQAEQLEQFANNLGQNETLLKSYSEMQKQFADMSKKSIGELTKQLSSFADEAAAEGLTDDRGSLADALFRQYFEFDEGDYQSMLSNTQRRIKDLGVDMQKAFNVDDLLNLNAKEFKGLDSFMNELQFQMGANEEAASAMVDALNEGIFATADFSKLSTANMAHMTGSQMSAAIDMIKQMQSGAEGLGSTLQSAFGDDVAAAFNNLSNVAAQGAEGFAGSMQNIFDSIGNLDISSQAQMINDLASAFDIQLSDEILEPLDFKIEVDDSGVQWLSQVFEDDTTKKIMQLDVETNAEQAKEEVESLGDNTAPIKKDVEIDKDSAQAELDGLSDNTTPIKKDVDLSVDDAKNQLDLLSSEDSLLKIDVDTSAVENKASQVKEMLGDKQDYTIDVDFNAKMDSVQDKISSLLSGSGTETVDVNVGADTTEAESAISSLADTQPVNVPLEFDFSSSGDIISQTEQFLAGGAGAVSDVEISVSADTSQAEAQIQALLSSEDTAKLTVQADTSQAESQIQSLMTSDSTAQLQVQADVSQAESEIASLSSSTRIEIPVDADVSAAVSAIESLGSSHSVTMDLDVRTGNASSAIQSVVNSAQSSVNVLSSQISAAAAQTAQISAGAAGASAALTLLLVQVQMAQAAIIQLQATAAVPISFNINVAQLTALPGQISSVGAAASAAMAQMRASIQATAAAFSAGCAQMVSAWASMSFPAPHIPMPSISVSAGVGTYNASISWHAAGGIIPATPGGRIVGVAEGGEDEAIIPISKLRDYIKESMSDVISDAMDDYTSAIEESWESFAIDYGTTTGSGYYSTKVEVPFLQLSDEATETLEKFTSKQMTLDITGYDPKNISYIIDYLTQDTNRYESLISDIDQEIEFYDNYGDSVQRARMETEKLVLQWKQSRSVVQDVNKLNEEIAAYQARASEDLSQYLDANLELNYLYAQRVDSFGEGNEEAKETFENQVKGYQELLKAMDEMQDKMRELNAEIAKSINEQAVELIENTITESYDSQIDYIQDRLDLVEREREAYEKDIEEQRDRLEKAKDEFNDNIELKDRELQDRIDAIKDAQDERENAEKLKDLQEKIKDAQDRLDGLTNDYNTKVYEMGEDGQWQFSYAADPEELEEATEDLEDAQNDLKEFYEDQEIDRLEKEQDRLDKEKEMYNDHYEDMMDALEEQQDMRLEAYDEEIENYEAHLDQLETLKDAALEQVDALANQLVNRLLSMFDRSYTAVFDYLQTANGNYGVQSYNPIAELFPTDYAQQLMEAGYNLEQYTNQLLEITRNPTKYSPVEVYNAQNELDKLGTTGSVDVSDHIQITPKLQAAMLEHGYYSVNDFIANTLNRIGTIRIEDSGIPGREAGTKVTASDVASYLYNLGVNADIVKVSELADKLAKNEVDEFGNVLNDILDRMEGYGTDYDFGESGQGLLTSSAWDNLLGTIMNFDGTAQDIYNITGKLITQNSDNLSIGENVVLHLVNSQKFLQQLTEDNQLYYDIMMGYYEKQTELMDANSYYSQENVAMSEGLLYAMKGSTDVNKFILEQLQRIGTVRESGEKAGQVVTKEDIFAYLAKLGISEDLIAGTVEANLKLNETQIAAVQKTQESIEAMLKNTTSISELERTSGYLDNSVRRNTSSVNILDDTLNDTVFDVKTMVKNFDTSLAGYVRQLGITANDVISAANSVRAAANQVAAAASASKDEKGYADGGVVSFTGATTVHGSPNAPEVVFNATDAAKLYDLVHGMDVSTLGLPKISALDLSNIFNNTKTEKPPMTIENVTMNFPHVDDPDGVKQAILNLDREIRLYVR